MTESGKGTKPKARPVTLSVGQKGSGGGSDGGGDGGRAGARCVAAYSLNPSCPASRSRTRARVAQSIHRTAQYRQWTRTVQCTSTACCKRCSSTPRAGSPTYPASPYGVGLDTCHSYVAVQLFSQFTAARTIAFAYRYLCLLSTAKKGPVLNSDPRRRL